MINIIYTPAIAKSYAGTVAKKTNFKMVDYEHIRFSCGESFSKPTDSLRGKRVVVLGTFNPETASEDALRLQIMLDGLKRMEIRGVDFVLPYFPQPLEMFPLFSWMDTLTSVELPPSIYLSGKQERTVHCSLIGLLRAGMVKSMGKPVNNLDAVPLFARHFVQTAGENGSVMVSVDQQHLSERLRQRVPADFGFAQLDFIRSKSGKRIVGEKLIGDIAGKRAVLLKREVESREFLRRIVARLKEGQVGEIHLGIVHPVFPNEVLRELSENEAISSVVTTDTTGIPGENFLKDGKVQDFQAPAPPAKFTLLSTVELVSKAIAALAKRVKSD